LYGWLNSQVLELFLKGQGSIVGFSLFQKKKN
jgi:hypothetical protein